jgi:hypothetical protein
MTILPGLGNFYRPYNSVDLLLFSGDTTVATAEKFPALVWDRTSTCPSAIRKYLTFYKRYRLSLNASVKQVTDRTLN